MKRANILVYSSVVVALLFQTNSVFSACAEAPHSDLLEARGYILKPISDLEILNWSSAVSSSDRDESWNKIARSLEPTQVLSTGTFYYGSNSVATVVRDGELDGVGSKKTWDRGALAFYSDGKIKICRQGGHTSVAAISEQCNPELKVEEQKKEEPSLPQTLMDQIMPKLSVPKTEKPKLIDFLGGAALLLENGKRVSVSDLKQKQLFTQGITDGRGRLVLQQMRATQHTIIASHNTLGTYLVLPKSSKSGQQIQDDFCEAGFHHVLKYDGGSGFKAILGSGKSLGSGVNRTGILVNVKN